MEFNTQNFNKSKQIRWSSDDLGGPGQVRSYTCTFCKRGFSNAQALGGHMNTHRRDRARLKQSSEKNLLSLDISIKNTTDHEPVPSEEKILFRFDSGEEKHDSNHKKPFTFPNKDNDHAPQRGKVIGTAELPHLPPFVGKLTAINEIRAESVVVQRIEGKKTDLDLELKLGPEPQEAPTLSTRENHKRPFTFPDKDNDHAPQRGKVISTAELPHLPSFVGRLTAINEIMAGSVVVQRIEEKKADLDLELRLGPEPQEALTLSTIEFF